MKFLHITHKTLSVLLLILFTVHIQAQPNKIEESINGIGGEPIAINHLEGQIQRIMDSIEMPGLSIAIINDKKIAYHHNFGVGNIETKEAVSPESIFEGASLSKPLFAYFVMKMVEEELIELDTPLYQYLEHPGIDEKSKEDYKLITARMVLSHQTGFPNHSEGKPISLAFKPGTGFQYSGEGYQYLLAAIGTIKGLGWGEEFNQFFEKEINEELGFNQTSFLWNEHFAENKVYGHKNGKPTNNDTGEWNGKNFISYASIHSNAKDYAKFILAMLKRQGLQPETFNEMLSEQVHFDDDNPLKIEVGQTGWGLGFAQKKTEDGTMHLHTGNNHDFQAY
ncbi:MAG: serine hydrolase domain-containing protein, partial [Flavobacteriaceae bacterium]|nr:serine hydrolase domain-containing protein [Flavobacteriaceae bacterium]